MGKLINQYSQDKKINFSCFWSSDVRHIYIVDCQQQDQIGRDRSMKQVLK